MMVGLGKFESKLLFKAKDMLSIVMELIDGGIYSILWP